MRSPTQRSLKLLKEQGYLTYVTEYYNAYAKVRKDLYGFIDIVGIHSKETGVLGIQTTTGSNLSARIKKAEGLEGYWAWLASGNDVEFHGWRKIKAGRKVATWQPIVRRISVKGMFS
jgi:hypothetical protein